MRKNLKEKETHAPASYYNTVGRNQIVRSEIFSLSVIIHTESVQGGPGRRKNTNILKMNLSCRYTSLRGPGWRLFGVSMTFFFWKTLFEFNTTLNRWAHLKFIVMTMNFYCYCEIFVCHFASLKLNSWLKIYILHAYAEHVKYLCRRKPFSSSYKR